MTEREQQWKIRHRLAVIRHAQEATGSLAATCRYHGISCKCYYRWLYHYEDLDRTLRTTTSEDQEPGVSGLRQLHSLTENMEALRGTHVTL